MKRRALILSAFVATTALFTTDAQAASWGQLKSGTAVGEQSPSRNVNLRTDNTETPEYQPDGVSTSMLMEMAEMLGYRVPAITSDPDTPSAEDAQRLLRWRQWFLATLDAEVSFEDVVACASAVIEGTHDRRDIDEVPISELFDLARSIGYRVPAIASDPDNPTAEDAQRILRWRTRFFEHLATEIELADLLDNVVDAFVG